MTLLLSERNELNFNLQSEFNFLNKTLFDNKVKPLPVRWYKMKRMLGVYHYRYNRQTRELLEENIKITTLYSFTQQQFREVLAHEMIHAYISQNNLEWSDHGSVFTREASRITSLGYRITVRNDQPLEVEPERDVYLPVIIAKVGYDYALSVFAVSKLSFLLSLENIYGRIYEPELYNVLFSKVRKFPRTNITSTFKIKWYRIDKNLYDNIKNNDKKLKEYDVLQSYEKRQPTEYMARTSA